MYCRPCCDLSSKTYHLYFPQQNSGHNGKTEVCHNLDGGKEQAHVGVQLEVTCALGCTPQGVNRMAWPIVSSRPRSTVPIHHNVQTFAMPVQNTTAATMVAPIRVHRAHMNGS